MAAEDDGETGYAKLVGRIFYVDDEARAKGVKEEDFDAIITALPARLGRHHTQPPPKSTSGGGEGKEGEGEGCFVALGTTKKVSRHHATINWDFIKGCYVIRCFSKNGMTVNKKHYATDEQALLTDRSAVRMGPVNFYFHLPPEGGEGAREGGLERREEAYDDEEDGGEGGREGEEGEEEGSLVSGVSEGGGKQGGGGGGGGRGGGRASHNNKPEGSMSYADMVMEAFACEELRERGREGGLTSHEVTQWLFKTHKEWREGGEEEGGERRKQLMNGIQNALTRKFSKQEGGREGAGPGGRGSRWKMFPGQQIPTWILEKVGGGGGGGGGGGSEAVAMEVGGGGGGAGEEAN